MFMNEVDFSFRVTVHQLEWVHFHSSHPLCRNITLVTLFFNANKHFVDQLSLSSFRFLYCNALHEDL